MIFCVTITRYCNALKLGFWAVFSRYERVSSSKLNVENFAKNWGCSQKYSSQFGEPPKNRLLTLTTETQFIPTIAIAMSDRGIATTENAKIAIAISVAIAGTAQSSPITSFLIHLRSSQRCVRCETLNPKP